MTWLARKRKKGSLFQDLRLDQFTQSYHVSPAQQKKQLPWTGCIWTIINLPSFWKSLHIFRFWPCSLLAEGLVQRQISFCTLKNYKRCGFFSRFQHSWEGFSKSNMYMNEFKWILTAILIYFKVSLEWTKDRTWSRTFQTYEKLIHDINIFPFSPNLFQMRSVFIK